VIADIITYIIKGVPLGYINVGALMSILLFSLPFLLLFIKVGALIDKFTQKNGE
jgi:hypothetical protein